LILKANAMLAVFQNNGKTTPTGKTGKTTVTY
jgi:hypothetical protein